MMTAPAVGIRVVHRVPVPEPAGAGQRRLDRGVGVEHLLAPDDLDVLVEPPRRSDRRIDVQPVADPGGVVVGAVSRRGVDRAGALLQRHVVGEHPHRVAVVERVAKGQAFEVAALQAGQRRAEVAPDRGRHRVPAFLRDDHGGAGVGVRAAAVVDPVVDAGVERHRQIRRDGPGGGGPDQHRDRASRHHRGLLREGRRRRRPHRELHVDGRRRVVLVLHLRLRQRGAAVQAPVDRLLPLVHHLLLDEPAEGAHDRRLVVRGHRPVRPVPGSQHAEALEVGRLPLDELLGVAAARAPEVGHAHVALLPAELLVHLELDGQPVAVPARHVGRVEAGHGPRPHDDVLQHLVEHVPDVDLPVGVGRAVVQHELRRPRAAFADARVQPHLVPARDRRRLRRLEVGAHREPRPGQVEGVLPVGHR